VKLYIVLIKLNSERKNNCTTDRKSPSLSRQQNMFTHIAQTVTILFDKNLPISILTQLPPLRIMRYDLFVFSFLLNNRYANRAI